ncbi:hypothetical protein A2483_04245 [Candidatus Peregrinibacteria bacterium RIFOXYC2_FULL_33_13]|nr:MAG: hypothetical protein UR30_C0016G0007 [Candidatus Peregrinibacteria bacterium GW2011_GWC2_33_13]OGJ49296.1 MAG: hypothetical protein A2229_01705 [Candidatus Peregrinibacteria bacterium RIFOXYA2_FULL_33_7]OGJ52721.1 MAG: hypothetical protein A2483_04245 [Candidatus Peregrinibacteria bacterium RIFOXYC2_FULL_33_13]
MQKIKILFFILVSYTLPEYTAAQYQIDPKYAPENLPTEKIGKIDEDIDIQILVGTLISPILKLATGIAIFFIVLGGFKWITAMGNQEKLDSGKKTLTWAILGFLVIIFAYLIVQIITVTMQQGLSTPSPIPTSQP